MVFGCERGDGSDDGLIPLSSRGRLWYDVGLASAPHTGEALTASSMVTCIGPLATINREPGQARKGAAAAVDSGAGVWLVQVATLYSPPAIPSLRYNCAFTAWRSVE